MSTTQFNEIENNLQKIKYFLNKEYLSTVTNDYAVYPFSDYNCKIKETNRERINVNNNIGCVKVSLWIKNKEELLIDKFKNIFASFEHSGKTVAFAINRQFDKAVFFFFVKTEITDQTDVLMYRSLLEKAIKGNFPGSQIEIIETVDENTGNKNQVFSTIFDNSLRNNSNLGEDNLDSSIAIVNAIATEKSEKFISQGLEKLIDGIIPHENQSYSIIFIAESLTSKEISLIKKGFEDLTTAITPYIQYQTSAGTSSTKSESSTKSLSHSHGVNESIAKTHGWGLNVSGTVGGSTTVGVSGSVAVGIPGLGGSATASTSQTVNYSATVGHNQNWSKTNTKGFSDTDTTGETTGKILTDGITEQTTLTNVSAELRNYAKLLEKEMNLMDMGKAIGLWKSAAYILAPTKEETINIANFLKSLIQGEDSILEQSSVVVWSNNENKNDFTEVKNYISKFTHPLLFNKNDYLELVEKAKIDPETGIAKNADAKGDVSLLTITNYVTTKELAAQMSFPQKAVPGMPVIDCVPFGREVTSLTKESSRKVELGKIYHMRQVEPKSVDLDLNSLTSHVFVTGSTGSGKSNTVYQLLRKAHKNGVKFLVVEPAKGEYKSVLGKETDVHIYGTNPKQTKLLKLNPFRFDVKTTMLHEHIDRLISIFNVCWPMYAAMPAVLKQAVEKSYADCGWDLSNPWKENEYDNNYFPCFADVARNVVEIINSSDYDNENKGAYKGSLVTRLTSLTNGFFGLIFTSKDDIDKDVLFDQNVIVDLSHVGSP